MVLIATSLFIIPIIMVSILVSITSKGPIIYWSRRVGKDNNIFSMPKFRTMRTDTPEVATHLLNDPNCYLTPIGGVLRRTSLDELPQLYSVLIGDMSFVGPRPALYNQNNLINLRTNFGIDILRPGITGWAQVNGRDEITINKKVLLDKYYLEKRSWYLDFFIIWLTIYRVIRKSGISH